jgi:hypothetical protein
MADEAMAAVLLQLAGHGERLAVLDDREAGHSRAVSDRLAEIANLLAGLGAAVQDQAAILAGLDGLAGQVTALTGRLDQIAPGEEGDPRVYRPPPAPRWWKLEGADREEALGRLRAWAEQVYRPGYGQLAATLGPCWEQHPLCLYGLDILSELWSVLYLQGRRSPAVLSAQAEYQARIVPAIAEQLMIETTRCGHARARTADTNGHQPHSGTQAVTGGRP